VNEPRENRDLLFVTPFFPPCGRTGVQRMLKFSKYLPQLGWRLTVLTADKPILGLDKSLCAEVPGTVEVVRRFAPLQRDVGQWAGRRFRWLGPVCHLLGKPPTWVSDAVAWRVHFKAWKLIQPDYTALWAYRCIPAALRLAMKRRLQVVMTSGPPHSTHLVGLVLRRLLGMRWIADFQDPWTRNYMTGPREGLPYRLGRILEPCVLDQADAVVTVGYVWADEFRLLGRTRPRANVHVIRNGFDEHDIAPHPGEQLGPNQDLLTFHHNGTYYGPQKLDHHFRAMAMFLRRRPEARGILWCTFTGLGTAELADAVRLGLEGIVLDVGQQEHRRSLVLCRQASALVLLIGEGPKMAGVITGKVYEYFALRRPILATIPLGGELDELLQRYKGSCIAGFSDVPAICRQIDHIYDRRKRDPDTTVPAPPWLHEVSRAYQSGQLDAILRRLGARPSGIAVRPGSG
jgi:hypothetical protein